MNYDLRLTLAVGTVAPIRDEPLYAGGICIPDSLIGSLQVGRVARRENAAQPPGEIGEGRVNACRGTARGTNGTGGRPRWSRLRVAAPRILRRFQRFWTAAKGRFSAGQSARHLTYPSI